MNKEGQKPARLDDRAPVEAPKTVDLATQEELTRFDKAKKKKKKKKKAKSENENTRANEGE